MKKLGGTVARTLHVDSMNQLTRTRKIRKLMPIACNRHSLWIGNAWWRLRDVGVEISMINNSKRVMQESRLTEPGELHEIDHDIGKRGTVAQLQEAYYNRHENL